MGSNGHDVRDGARTSLSPKTKPSRCWLGSDGGASVNVRRSKERIKKAFLAVVAEGQKEYVTLY